MSMEAVEDGVLYLGENEIDTHLLAITDLEDLQNMYEGALRDVPHTGHLSTVHNEIQTIIDAGREMALDELERYEITFAEAPDARYQPGLKGATLEDGVVKVGRPGRLDRPYYVVTELSHELLHDYLREECGVDEYTALEEGMMQIWNLHRDDIIGHDPGQRVTRVQDHHTPEEAVERLEAVRTLYDESGLVPDGFGTEIYDYAAHFLSMYETVEGSRDEKMQAVLDLGIAVLTGSDRSEA